VGFFWATRNKVDSQLFTFSLFVLPEQRRQGIGRRLYDELEQFALQQQAHKLRVSVWDDCPEDRLFAERHGFRELSHQTAWILNLAEFDDAPYAAVLSRLEAEGFIFTDMEALGNSADAQRKLYTLNETTNMQTLGATGEPAWASFEDFQSSVCGSDWYRPAGQIVAIDTATGDWVAMSAISRFDGLEEPHAYNLFTGVVERYRGRKLAQAVKVLALRYARVHLAVRWVKTNHNSKNAPIIAIDRKLGYVQTPGAYSMEKCLP
jgi:GNAT superfamily N-acetyltransferase